MITESRYWKKELLKLAYKLNKRLIYEERWSETQLGTFEKDVMIGFYIVRKLIENKKVSNHVISRKIMGKKFPNNGNTVNRMNNHRFFEFYDFECGKVEKFDLIFLCNQIVHSYIFSPNFDCVENEIGKLTSILFCSDTYRNDFIIKIEISSVINIFQTIGNNYPSSIHSYFVPMKKDWKIISKDEAREIPEEFTRVIGKLEKEQKENIMKSNRK